MIIKNNQFFSPDWHGVELPGSPKNNFNAIGLRKHSEFTKMFDYHILKMRQSGLLAKMLEDWNKKIIALESDPGIEAYPLAYDNLLFPFLILSTGTAIALLLLILEWVINKWLLN